jgi:hypothetical protein
MLTKVGLVGAISSEAILSQIELSPRIGDLSEMREVLHAHFH